MIMFLYLENTAVKLVYINLSIIIVITKFLIVSTLYI